MITAWSSTTEWKLSGAYSSLQIGSPNTGLLLGNYCERAMSSGSTTVVMNISVISVVAAAMQSSFIVGSKKIIYAVFIVLKRVFKVTTSLRSKLKHLQSKYL